MLTIFIEIMMSVFIANFKASEHPIITTVVRGVLFAITIFIFGIYFSISDKENFDLIFIVSLSLVSGLFMTVFLLLIDIIFNKIDKK